MKKDYRNLLLALLLLSFLIYFYCYLPNSKIVEGVANSCWGDTSTLRDSIATFGGGRETPEEGMEEQARKDAEAEAEDLIGSMCNIYNGSELPVDKGKLQDFIDNYEKVFSDFDDVDDICEEVFTATGADQNLEPGFIERWLGGDSTPEMNKTCSTLRSVYQLAKKLHNSDVDFESDEELGPLLAVLELRVVQDDIANTTVVEDGECDWTQLGTPEAQLALTNIESCGSLPNTSDVANCKETNRTGLGTALGASGCLADEELLDYDHINMLADSLMSFRLDRQGDRGAGGDGDRDAGGDGDRDAGGDGDRDAGGDGGRDANIPAAPKALPPDVKRRDESTFSAATIRGKHPNVHVDAAPLRYRLQGGPEWGGAPAKGCLNLQDKKDKWTKRWQEISRVEGSDADACSKYCATDPECKWFWHYDNGRCCPKKEMSGGWKTVPGGQMYRLCREGATGQHSPERCT